MAGASPSPRAPFAGRGHDHQRCIDAAMTWAERICRRRGARLTDLRRRVLVLVWGSHEPVGAYDVLDRLREDRQRAAPPTVYRALDFLLEHGLVHRIESLNAYVGCSNPEGSHVGQFLICDQCGTAAEIDDRGLASAVARTAGRVGFQVQRQTIEVRGLCPRCR